MYSCGRSIAQVDEIAGSSCVDDGGGSSSPCINFENLYMLYAAQVPDKQNTTQRRLIWCYAIFIVDLHFDIKERSIYQDRLGTDTKGNAESREGVFFLRVGAADGGARDFRAVGAVGAQD